MKEENKLGGNGKMFFGTNENLKEVINGKISEAIDEKTVNDASKK